MKLPLVVRSNPSTMARVISTSLRDDGALQMEASSRSAWNRSHESEQGTSRLREIQIGNRERELERVDLDGADGDLAMGQRRKLLSELRGEDARGDPESTDRVEEEKKDRADQESYRASLMPRFQSLGIRVHGDGKCVSGRLCKPERFPFPEVTSASDETVRNPGKSSQGGSSTVSANGWRNPAGRSSLTTCCVARSLTAP